MENGANVTDFGFGGIWGIIMLLIVAGLFSNGGFGFGGGNSAGVTEEYIANQFTNRDIWSTNTNVLTSASATQNEILNNRANCNNNYSNLRYDMAVGNANLEKDVLLGNQTLQANMDSCCCTLRSEMRDQIQSVKDLINNNTIQDLRDQLNTSVTANANAVQTQTILGNLGRFYINQPINPYYAYGYGSGTTII